LLQNNLPNYSFQFSYYIKSSTLMIWTHWTTFNIAEVTLFDVNNH